MLQQNRIIVGAAPLLSQEGWREEPGWFQSETLLYCGFGTTPRAIASQSRCPPDLGGQSSHLRQIQFLHSYTARRSSAALKGYDNKETVRSKLNRRFE